MGSKGSTKVQAPDPIAVAQADARFNRIDQYTPLGSLQFMGPDRNQAVQTLNPALQYTQNQDFLSDIMLNNMALGRQTEMKGGSLPSLTQGLDPTAQQEFFGLPNNLQQGSDAPSAPPPVPDFVGQFQQGIPAPTGTPTGGPRGGGRRGAGPNPGVSQGINPNIGPRDMSFSQTGFPGGAATPPAQPPQQGAKGGLPQGAQNFQPAPQQTTGAPQSASNSLFGGTVGSLFDPNEIGTPGDISQLQDFDLDRGRVEQSYYDRTSSLLNPQFDQSEERLLQNLANRGIPRDSEAAEREIANFQRNKGETYGRLANDAVLAGGGEQSRLFGISSQLGQQRDQGQGQLFGMGQQLAQQDIQTQLQNANIQQANRATQFNELASLLGLNQVAQHGLQNFFAPANADVTGGFALNQQAQATNANNAARMKGGMLVAAAGLGSAAILR